MLIENLLTEESEGSEESVKYRSGDPILGKNFFFPVSSCQTTRTPSTPPGYHRSVKYRTLIGHLQIKKFRQRNVGRGGRDMMRKGKDIFQVHFHLQLLKIHIPEYK